MWKGPWMLQTIQVWSQKDGKKLCGSKKDLSGKAEEQELAEYLAVVMGEIWSQEGVYQELTWKEWLALDWSK